MDLAKKIEELLGLMGILGDEPPIHSSVPSERITVTLVSSPKKGAGGNQPQGGASKESIEPDPLSEALPERLRSPFKSDQEAAVNHAESAPGGAGRENPLRIRIHVLPMEEEPALGPPIPIIQTRK